MLETLNKPNIKTIVLEDVVPEPTFHPELDLDEGFYQNTLKSWTELVQENFSLIIDKVAKLSVLYPHHREELKQLVTSGKRLEDDLELEYYSLQIRTGKYEDSDDIDIVNSRFVDFAFGHKVLDTGVEFQHHETAIKKAFRNINRRPERHIAKYQPLAFLSVVHPEVREWIDRSKMKKFYDNLDENIPSYFRNAGVYRLLNPDDKMEIPRSDWRNMKWLFPLLSLDNKLDTAFASALVSAEKIDIENGLKLYFSPIKLGESLPPYPVLDKTGFKT